MDKLWYHNVCILQKIIKLYFLPCQINSDSFIEDSGEKYGDLKLQTVLSMSHIFY